MLGLCRFCLDFSEFGYVTNFFYVPNFFYVFLKHRKSLGHFMNLCFSLHKNGKNQGRHMLKFLDGQASYRLISKLLEEK